jgi:nicotinate-nucleotide adenylyltransferase
MDAFLGLTSWREWERLLSYVNIAVARRPGALLSPVASRGLLLAERGVDAATTTWERAGQILVQDGTQLEVAATDLRASIRAGIAPRYLVPDAVRNIIVTSGCYAGKNESP